MTDSSQNLTTWLLSIHKPPKGCTGLRPDGKQNSAVRIKNGTWALQSSCDSFPPFLKELPLCADSWVLRKGIVGGERNVCQHLIIESKLLLPSYDTYRSHLPYLFVLLFLCHFYHNTQASIMHMSPEIPPSVTGCGTSNLTSKWIRLVPSAHCPVHKIQWKFLIAQARGHLVFWYWMA